MPQFDQLGETGYLVSQLFWLALVFGAIFLIIGRGMLPKVEATVDARDAKIAGDLAAAKAARDSADAIEQDWRNRQAAARSDAQAIVAAAKAKGANDNAARLAAAMGEVEARLTKAEAGIAKARASAMAEVESVAAESAQALVQRLTGRNVTAAQAAAAVRTQLNG